MVYDLLQSRDGFIWIATGNGLNRYDGARFDVFLPEFDNPFSIGSREVYRLFEDSRGWIWMELFDGSIDVLDPGSGHFFHVLARKKDGSDSDFVTVRMEFAETPDGAVWYAGHEGLLKFSLQRDMLKQAIRKDEANLEPICKKVLPTPSAGGQSTAALYINCLYFTQSQKLLLGTPSGLWALDPNSEKWTLVGMPTASISWIGQDPAGRIWMRHRAFDADMPLFIQAILPATTTTVWDEKSGIAQGRTIEGHLEEVIHDATGFFWARQGDFLKKFQTRRFLNNEPADIQWSFGDVFSMQEEPKTFTALLPDRSGMLWIGSIGAGISKINFQSPVFRSYFPSVDINSLIATPEGKFMVRGRGRDPHYESIDSFDPHESFPYRIFPLLDERGAQVESDERYGDLQFDQAGNSWYRTELRYILRQDAQTGAIRKFECKGYELCFDAKGRLLTLDSTGLVVFDPNTTQHSYFDFKKTGLNIDKIGSNSDDFWALWKASDGMLWILGPYGLIKATPADAGYRFEYYTHNRKEASSLSSNKVLSIAEDPMEPKRYLWVGTGGGGLNRLDKRSGKFIQFNTVQGLPSNTVYGILAENQKPFIWLSTDRGLCRFDIQAQTIVHFTAADGLPDDLFTERAYLKIQDGSMIFGGINGLTVFYPDSLHLNTNAPQTRIVGLRVNNKPVYIGEKTHISLSRDENMLAFDFAALEFSNPAQNQYRYQLVGVDKGWVFLGTRNSVEFTALSPGTYTFKVMGSNNHGIWSEQPAEFRFTIRPPWWASWWAYLVYLGLIGTGIWHYYQYLLRQRLSEQEKLRLRALDDFKSRFFTNITHEFRTPLTVILGLSEQVLGDRVTQSHPVTIARPLSLIKRNGENLLRLINQILDLSKLESNTLKMNYIQGDILTFIKYIVESLHSLANAQNLMLLVESKQGEITMDYDPERFLQIVHNLLSNAIKFTPSGGKVVLNVSTDPAGLEGRPSLHLRITDSGAGIPPDELPHIFDRFFQARNQDYAKAGGAGIGLSLTRELVRAMGGDISAESTVGAGTTFLIKLPITNNSAFVYAQAGSGAAGGKPAAIKPLIPRTPVAGATSGYPDNAPTLLLIEDNPDVVEYLTACLKDQFILDFAYNGEAGIEKALENVPDLVISDVMMPFKDGFEVLEALKNDGRSSHVPVILLTAKADVQSRLAGLRRGADAYLSKPFNQEELLVTIENLLELRRTLQQRYRQNILTTEPVMPAAVPADPEDAFLQQVRNIIEANYADDTFGLPQLCQKIGMSRSQLFRKMKALTDIAPSDLIRKHRLNKAKALLESGAVNVSEAAWEVGFKDPSYFSKLYQEEFGVAPREVRP